VNILALDTSDSVISAALSFEGGTVHIEADVLSRHSELLMDFIDRLFKTASIKQEDLELAACMKGPGSFTGLRIGFSTAKGLSLALGIPLVTAPTLDCMAHNLSIWPGIVLAVIDAKKGCFFSGFYRRGKLLSSYLDASPTLILEQLELLRLSPEEPLAITGPGTPLLCEKLKNLEEFGKPRLSSLAFCDPSFRRGRALELLEIVRHYVIVKEAEDIYSGPLYLRKSDAELNLKSAAPSGSM
jgi:tRNA threonylcarbamoyladenosine biosynthesis protein TsaB